MPAILDKISDALHLRNTPLPSTTTRSLSSSSSEGREQVRAARLPCTRLISCPGKGTQCSHLVDDFGFCHLSAGDLLRAEQHREGSEFGQLIQNCIKEGTIVPMEVTVKLLQNAMTDALKEPDLAMAGAIKFDEDVCQASMVLFFSTTEQVMLERLLDRGKTSGREDDNVESIKKRFTTYKETTMPVIQHYQSLGKVAEIDSSPSVEEVHQKAKAVVEKILVK
ncbi:UMP-CMP kinase [Mycena olivaceomarginata]|nr:UMP-CMP kinase [Mycena olivaceomarginata]